MTTSPAPSPAEAVSGSFAPTRWSVVLAAGRSNSTHARNALESLCRSYWLPIYYYVRRQGHNPQDAEDLTQEFFARLLAKNYLGEVNRAKGRFRSFMLAALKHFLANEWDKAGRQKRGGHPVLIPLNTIGAEAGGLELADGLSAERAFERRWALTLLDEVLGRLRAEYASEAKPGLFEQLKDTLTGERRALPYAEIAERLKMSEGAVKVAVYRLRQRYRALLHEEIAQTVSTPEEVEEEIQALFAALAG